MPAEARGLGIGSGVGIVVATTVGAGVFVSTGFMAQSMGPASILLAWLAGAAIALAISTPGTAAASESAARSSISWPAPITPPPVQPGDARDGGAVVRRDEGDDEVGALATQLALRRARALASQPPTTVEKDRAVWGPFTPVLSPVTYRLVIDRVASGHFTFHLDGRPKSTASDDAFVPVVVVSAVPRLLSRLANASRSREGRARATRCRATRTRRCRGDASSRRTPPPLLPPRGLTAVVQLLRRQRWRT